MSCPLASTLLSTFPSPPLPFSRNKTSYLLRATPTSTTIAVDVIPSKFISQSRSPEWWIDCLRSKVRSNLLREAVLTYIDMIVLGIKPDNFAFPALLKAVADLHDVDLGKQIHAHVYKFGYGVDSVTVANTLVNLYRKCGDLGEVYKVFDRISERNQVSWNSLISSLCSFEKWEMALEAFRCMLDENVEPKYLKSQTNFLLFYSQQKITQKMQGASSFIKPTIPLHLPSSLSSSSPNLTFLLPHKIKASRLSSLRSNNSSSDPNTVDYNSSLLSVFPAEACEVISGYACSADIYPEVKLDSKPTSRPLTSEPFDREYEDYNNTKTVFREEACDDLGGEFCDPDYQKDAK